MCFVATKQTRYLGLNLALSFVELFLIICIKFVADVLLCILISSNIFPSSDYIYLCYQRSISKALVRIPRNKSHVGTLFIDQIKNICWIKFGFSEFCGLVIVPVWISSVLRPRHPSSWDNAEVKEFSLRTLVSSTSWERIWSTHLTGFSSSPARPPAPISVFVQCDNENVWGSLLWSIIILTLVWSSPATTTFEEPQHVLALQPLHIEITILKRMMMKMMVMVSST